ncbi:alpha/beta fold hydrolase [Luteimonas sp. MJ204]|uniref:YheT family hydrolase n=1 Tax=Luteimonas sp. MJ145 TaxID=3129234 RepID=UPI0031BB477F
MSPATASPYRPPRWLRNAHLQSVLAGSPLRRRRGLAALAASGALTREVVVDGGGGVRLLGLHTALPGVEPRGMALLLHGWEGSAESAYVCLAAAGFLARGYDVFRLNFRDHGGSHHLNPDIFHSARIDEVVHAARDIAGRMPRPRLVVAGHSLGGNFALRLALRAPAAGLLLDGVAAVCPVLDPARTMEAMERGLPLYMHHFERSWRRSLVRKRELFPDRVGFDDAVLRLRMRALTEWLVLRHTDFGSLAAYFDGYSIAGDRLAGLAVPASILTSADDPVIPVDDFHRLALPAGARLEVAAWGGHCGFIEGPRLDGYAERWVVERLAGEG